MAWLVVLFHFSAQRPFNGIFGIPAGKSSYLPPPLSNGPFAVDCFFVLSGFILFHVHSELGDKFSLRNSARFLWARLARIYPLHLALLALFAVSIAALALRHVAPNAPERFSPGALFMHLFLLHGWGITTRLTWNYPSWSISSEWAAYLLAPLMFWAIMRLRGAVLLLSIAVLGFAIAYLLRDGEPSLRLAFVRVMLGFTLGALACRARDLHQSRLARCRTLALFVAWALFCAMLASHHGGLMVAAFTAACVFHGLPRSGPSRLSGLMRLPIYLGETSFAVYMGHAFIENAFLTLYVKLHLAQHLSISATALCLVVAIQGFASILHHGIEVPAQRLLRGAIRFRPYVPAAATMTEIEVLIDVDAVQAGFVA